jgi:hypothetical protein
MRKFAISLAVLALGGLIGAQVLVSNAVPRTEAIRIASHLKVGMKEKDASELLARSGLTNAISVGAMPGWARSYQLADGTSLLLDYRHQDYDTNYWWEGYGILESASIQSNGITIVSITLTNAP